MPRVFIGLGSNLGDRIDYLNKAVGKLGSLSTTSIANCSSLYETEPIGVREQPKFLNIVVELKTELKPGELFSKLKDIESKAGRRNGERWGPREIDLDLLYYGEEKFNDGILCVPHPEIKRRKFVLVPLNEVAPDFVDPISNMEIRDILDRCPDTSEVLKIGRPVTEQLGADIEASL